MNIKMHTDGGARGNPGPAGIGVVISDKSGNIIKEISRKIGKATNNVAEYTALLAGLEEAKKLKVLEIDIYMDSELVVKQLKREYKVRDENLAKLFIKAWNLLCGFKRYSLNHIPREKNKKADKLVNIAIDGL
jgi:ribonuclease HI